MTESINKLLEEVENCKSCDTIIGYKKFSLKSHGNLTSKFILVSEAPGKDSISQCKYWTGVGGKILRFALEGLDKELEDIFYLTDIVKCWPIENEGNRIPYDNEIVNCSNYLYKEIDILQPKLVLSLGKTSSEFILKQEITLKTSHGKLFDLNEKTKVLVMYHPSGIDRFMKRETYVEQLTKVFYKLIQNDLSNLENIFVEQQDETKPKKEEVLSKTSSSRFNAQIGVSFILPAPSNSITKADVSKNQLRITAAFKSYFPNSDVLLTIKFKDEVFSVKFSHRGRRSHILKLGSKLMNKLNLNLTNKVKITKTGSTEFVVEKL